MCYFNIFQHITDLPLYDIIVRSANHFRYLLKFIVLFIYTKTGAAMARRGDFFALSSSSNSKRLPKIRRIIASPVSNHYRRFEYAALFVHTVAAEKVLYAPTGSHP